MSSAQPLNRYDACPSCVYLGPFGDEQFLVGDLWYCDEDGTPVVLIQYDDDRGFQELAGFHGLPWVLEANRRAKARGLTVIDWPSIQERGREVAERLYPAEGDEEVADD